MATPIPQAQTMTRPSMPPKCLSALQQNTHAFFSACHAFNSEEPPNAQRGAHWRPTVFLTRSELQYMMYKVILPGSPSHMISPPGTLEPTQATPTVQSEESSSVSGRVMRHRQRRAAHLTHDCNPYYMTIPDQITLWTQRKRAFEALLNLLKPGDIRIQPFTNTGPVRLQPNLGSFTRTRCLIANQYFHPEKTEGVHDPTLWSDTSITIFLVPANPQEPITTHRLPVTSLLVYSAFDLKNEDLLRDILFRRVQLESSLLSWPRFQTQISKKLTYDCAHDDIVCFRFMLDGTRRYAHVRCAADFYYATRNALEVSMPVEFTITKETKHGGVSTLAG